MDGVWYIYEENKPICAHHCDNFFKIHRENNGNGV